MAKEITASFYVSIDGTYHRWEDLPKEKQKEISIALNDRAALAMGYKHKDKTA